MVCALLMASVSWSFLIRNHKRQQMNKKRLSFQPMRNRPPFMRKKRVVYREIVELRPYRNSSCKRKLLNLLLWFIIDCS